VNDDGEAGFATGPFLVADVDLRRGIVADQQDVQSGGAAGPGRKGPDGRPKFAANRGGAGDAV
jgi:hypothetical protein